MGHKEQFGRRIAIPRLVDWLVKNKIIIDTSYGNDIAPSFEILDPDDPSGERSIARLWVDSELRREREMAGLSRFWVNKYNLKEDWDNLSSVGEKQFDDLEQAIQYFFKLGARGLPHRYSADKAIREFLEDTEGRTIR